MDEPSTTMVTPRPACSRARPNAACTVLQPVGSVDAIEGTSTGQRYTMWCMKEPDYVMRLMATGGSLLADDETCKLAHRGVGDSRVSFRYTRPYDWHFRYRHAVDDHNNLRHTLPSLEDTLSLIHI